MERHNRGFGLIGLLILVAVVGVVFAAAISRSKTTKQANPGPTGPYRGVAFTPKTFDGAGTIDFYAQAKVLGNSASWHGDWAELTASKFPYNFTTASQEQGLQPIILLGTHSEQQGEVNAIRPLDETTKASYVNLAKAYADKFKPPYLGIGNEVNRIAKGAPADFEQFVVLFNETVAAIKQASPQTKVFVSFQLESIKGLGGGLFGGNNDATKHQWALLERFDKADVLAFTTYPGLIYKDPTEIPADYYSEIRSKTTKPIAFSEVGWSATTVASGWESSPAEQAEFINLFFDRTEPLMPEFSTWLLLYDQPTGPAFKTMGLIGPDGPRPGFAAWQR